MKSARRIFFQLFLMLIALFLLVFMLQTISGKELKTIEAKAAYDVSSATRGDLLFNEFYQTFSTVDSTTFLQKLGKSTTKESAQWSMSQLGSPEFPVSAYIIEYVTVNHAGEKIPCSGVVLIPEKTDATPMPLLVYQHATIMTNGTAPSISIQKASGESNTMAGAFASDGYVVAISDYVGTGQPNCLKYPSEYLFADSEAANGVDILIATQHLLEQLKLSTNGQLFLSGYSEGGQAVSALAELIQNDYPQYPVTAAVFMEGPYNMNAAMNNFLETPGGVIMDGRPGGSLVCAKAIYAYQQIYNWGTMDAIFNKPYDTRVEKNFANPATPLIILASNYPKETDNMFTAAFLSSAKDGDVSQDIAANDTDNWVPQMPVTFLTSSEDGLIPASVTENAYEKMLAAGGNVKMSYTQYPLNHLQNYMQAIVQSKGIFDSYVNATN
ncbi:alpha/beta hydrolase family protein [Acetobacterium bakii]|uniref:Lipase n=1 Tax=Acetobacterium bakii TaxID=52689 RepID=A0A0L6U3D5_9FIRM|nr:hypothetical protein [Acetobacterium bakii]KNZ42300.1 hypothetical protein AKG39_07255 [Acetobacterium bakii]